MMTKGYIFDYGGTLDTGGLHWGKVLWHAYVRHSVAVTEEQFRDAYVYAERYLGSNRVITPNYTFKDTLDAKLSLELEHLNDTKALNLRQNELVQLKETLLEDVYTNVIHETAKSRKILEALSQSRPLALVSNFYGNINTVLREFGLNNLFTAVIESAVVGIRKPDPRIFTIGVKALGTKPEETTVVGDSFEKDIIPAKLAGCHTIWLKGEGWTDKAHDESLPDAVITGLEQLLQGPQ